MQIISLFPDDSPAHRLILCRAMNKQAEYKAHIALNLLG